MRLAQILALLKSEPLLCTDVYRSALLEIFEEHAALPRAEFQAKRSGKARSGEALEIEQMEIVNGIAHIPVGGPIGMKLGEFEKGAGAVDVDDVANELDEAEASDEVRAILLDFDTPGGMVTGTPELGQRILEVDKPIWAFSRGQISSAGYWLAASCDGIIGTRSADFGCIGVYVPIADYSEMAAKMGVKIKVFSSGTYKGMGVPGTSLTAEQEIFLQRRVMEIADMFYEHVRGNRGDIKDEDMQGQTFKGVQALEKGLIDHLVGSKEEAVRFLS